MIFKRVLINRLSGSWMITALVIILSLPVIIGVALYLKSTPLLEMNTLWQLIGSSKWMPGDGEFGFWIFIYNSLYVTILAFLFAAPLCLFAAIYLTQFATKRLMQFMYPVIDILAGIPSVIYGMWGILVIVPFVSKIVAPLINVNSSGYSILAGGIVLAVMCIPYMLNMLIETFKTVPIGLKEAALSLGSTLWESIKHVVIKKSYPANILSSRTNILLKF